MKTIHLKPEDLTLIRAMAKHRTAGGPNKQGLSLEYEIAGLKGEAAFGIMIGNPLLWNWRCPKPSDNFPDYIFRQRTIDVKTHLEPGGDLLVRGWNKTPPSAKVLVVMEVMKKQSEVRCVGWAYTSKVCIPKYWDEGMPRPCWNYPRRLLKDWE